MKAPRSLRRDLALGLAAGLTALWIVAMLGASMIVGEELDEVYDSLMEETADRLLPLADAQTGDTPTPQAEALLTWVLRDGSGAIVAGSAAADAATFATPAPDGFSTRGANRYFVRPSGDLRLEVASPLQERREATWGVLSALLLPALLLLPLCLLGIVWFTGARLRPVAALSAEVAGRHPGDLSPLETADLQAELLPVRDEINRLMATLSQALEAERAFSADAAHELRTPIAATLAHVQLLIETADGPAQDRARLVEAELKRLTRMVEKLLQLARAEHAAMGEPLADARPVLRLVASDFGLEIDCPAQPVAMPLDADSFAILVRNLIENAVTHGRDVRISLSADGVLIVSNDGPVVLPDMLARLTRRFERGGARADGSGLGLAIVQAVATRSGLELRLNSPRAGASGGFEARVAPVADTG